MRLPKKRLCYSTRNHSIISKFPNIDKLSLKYNGKTINVVTIAFLAIWNNGKNTIYPSDFLKDASLSVYTVDKSKILEMEIVYFSNKLNGFKINNTENNLFKVNFNYLEENEGVILKIVHTGTSSKNIVVNCHIKGDKRPSQINFTNFYNVISHNRYIVLIRSITPVLLAFMLIALFIIFLNTFFGFNFYTWSIAIFSGLLLAAYFDAFITRILSKRFLLNWKTFEKFNIHEEIYKNQKK